MPVYRAQAIFPFFTNLPTDVAVNQFHFLAAPDDIDVVASEVFPMLNAFYATVYGAAAARSSYIDWPQAVIKLFNLDDPTPRIPVISPPIFGTTGTNSSNIPTEVACVLSFHAAPQSGVRFQRLYNRIFLGGLGSTAMIGSAADAFPRLNPTFITQVSTAAQNLLEAGETTGALWQQVSEAGGTRVTRNIVGGWVDNSPDTQRRRSVLASLRNNWLPIP